MKNYIVRRIGWVFDDDWYNFDGNHDIESIYKTEKEAISRVDHLNHIYFIHMGFTSRPFQLNFNHTKKDEFVSRDNLANLISSNLKIDLAEIYNPRKGFIWKDRFSYLSKLNTKQISKILKEVNLSFFKYYEFNSDNLVLHTFIRNPKLWAKYVDEFTPADEFYSFYDDRDMNDNFRIANTRLECYYYAIEDDYNSIKRKLNEETFYSGELKKISNSPDLLNSIIEQSPNITYNTSKSQLAFDKNVTANELMLLDSVLNDPILLLKEIPVTKSIFKNEEGRSFYQEIKDKYKITTDNNR